MLRVYECVTSQHDLRFVVVAGLICLFACFTAINLLGRSRLSEGRTRVAWLSVAAVVGGAGIWATHFVAMLAFIQDVPVGYDLGLTVLSIAIAICVTFCGFFLFLERFGGVIAAGALVGLAVSSMHYVGMAAVRIPADASWDMGYVASSVLIGVAFGIAALKVARPSVPSFPKEFAAGSLYALGILGMHFTAMAAVTYSANPLLPYPTEVLDPEWLSVAVAVVTVLIIGFGLVGSVADHHMADRLAVYARRLEGNVDELESTKKELEQTARNLTLALDQAASSNMAKSRFLATMSHELRTPLNAVIGFAELMQKEIYGPLGDDRYREYARDIQNSGGHLLGLINDVLDISKLDSGDLDLREEEFSLKGVVEDARRMIRHQAESADISLTVDVEPNLPRIRGDERRVRQVLLNLLSNAVKFTENGGAVSLLAERRGNEVAVVVSDTGIGMAPEEIPVALERFGQIDGSVNRRYEGTGLGLPLAKSLVEMHDGTLSIESEPGAGTTVTIVFPASRLVEVREVA